MLCSLETSFNWINLEMVCVISEWDSLICRGNLPFSVRESWTDAERI